MKETFLKRVTSLLVVLALILSVVIVTPMKAKADDLKNKVLTSDELARVAAGESAVIYLDVKNMDSSITDSEKQLIAAQLGTDTLGIYLDISLYKKVSLSRRQ